MTLGFGEPLQCSGPIELRGRDLTQPHDPRLVAMNGCAEYIAVANGNYDGIALKDAMAAECLIIRYLSKIFCHNSLQNQVCH